jgi:hypothetical protein
VDWTEAANLRKGVHADDAPLRVDSEEAGNKACIKARDIVISIVSHRRLLALRLWHVLANLKDIVRVILCDDDIFLRS